MKKLILVVSPPACGKTFISKKLAENLKHVVYLDKDTLVPLSNVVFDCANQKEIANEDLQKILQSIEDMKLMQEQGYEINPRFLEVKDRE